MNVKVVCAPGSGVVNLNGYLACTTISPNIPRECVDTHHEKCDPCDCGMKSVITAIAESVITAIVVPGLMQVAS